MFNQEKAAQEFVNAIKTIASKPGNLDNLQSYLAHCFTAWLEKHASTPEDMAAEMTNFAEMEL